MDEPMIKHHYPAGLPENLRETWDNLAEIPLEDRGVSRALLHERAKRELEYLAHAEAWQREIDAAVAQSEAAEARAEAAAARNAELLAELAVEEGRVEDLERAALMACIEPRPDCGCSGCAYAAEVNGDG